MNKAVKKLLKDRYFLTNETKWDDLANRVSAIYPPIKQYIEEMIFIPSTPTLTNANTNGERLGTLSSCFPMDIEDSIDGIYKAVAEGAKVTQYGGGIGYDFSSLRGSSELVSTINRISSGPLPFIRNFDVMLDAIQQGGVRRGAGMALLDIHHPDILNFIKAKEDTLKFECFNFSIKVPNSFYKDLVKNPNKIHKVKNRKDDKSYPLKNKEGKEITTKQLWDEIIDYAWKTGEPGIFNYEIALDQCTVSHLSDKVISNPCITGDTLVSTLDGLRTIKELTEQWEEGNKDIKIYTFNIKTKQIEEANIEEIMLTRTNAEIIEIETEDGDTLKLTLDHQVYVENKGWVKAKDLTEEDVLIKIS